MKTKPSNLIKNKIAEDNEIKVENETLLIMREEDVLAIVE